MYVKALRDAHWPNPILASSTADTSSVLGPTGVKMTGPYDWVPPGYWYDPRADGGADGFNTETSAGQSIPEIENLRRMLSRDELRALWTEPRTPQYHAGVGDSVFKTFHIFDRAMTARMGAPTEPRRLRPQGAGDGVRERARDVRVVLAEQVRGDRA